MRTKPIPVVIPGVAQIYWIPASLQLDMKIEPAYREFTNSAPRRGKFKRRNRGK